MSPAEQQALLTERAPKGGDGAADAIKAYDVLASRISQLNHQLVEDPAAYAATYDPSTREAAVAFGQQPSPENAQAYAESSLAAQDALGAPQPKLLTEGQSHAMSSRLALTGNGEAVVQAIGSEAQMWGRYWPQALAEASPKLNPAVQVIALGMDPVPAARLATVEEERHYVPVYDSQLRRRHVAHSPQRRRRARYPRAARRVGRSQEDAFTLR
jgi:hypothetical protein